MKKIKLCVFTFKIREICQNALPTVSRVSEFNEKVAKMVADVNALRKELLDIDATLMETVLKLDETKSNF